MEGFGVSLVCTAAIHQFFFMQSLRPDTTLVGFKALILNVSLTPNMNCTPIPQYDANFVSLPTGSPFLASP
jgi:hypothetical protein